MTSSHAWPRLTSDEVHVWRAWLREGSVSQRAVSMEDRLRADRFRRASDRSRYLAARGLLRSILGMYLGSDPCGLEFGYTPYGKPGLAGQASSQDLRFNMSRSGGVVLVAVARGRDIGIDVERCRAALVTRRAVELALPAREAARFWTLAPAVRIALFFRAWTRLEARLKAAGGGLARTTGSTAIGSGDGDGSYSIADVVVGDGYAGALAVAGRGCRLQHWVWH